MGELVNQPGIGFVGALSQKAQLVQIATADYTKASQHRDTATKLIDFVNTEQIVPAIRRFRMEPVGLQGRPVGRKSP